MGHVVAGRRTSAVAVALVLALSAALVVARPRDAAATDITRLAGPGRIETAVAASASAWDAASDVVLARASDFPDALAAGALAASLDAPLLLTHSEDLPAEVTGELRRLGARTVHLMGGDAAISEAVSDELAGEGYAIERVAGADRFDTAAAAALAAGSAPSGEALVALGAADDPSRAWPDALSAGAFAATVDRPPLVLTASDALPGASLDALGELASEGAIVHLLGGTGAVSDAVAAQLATAGYVVDRIAGAGRFETSTLAASAALRRMDATPRPLVVASGEAFPDGLAAAALAARLGGVLLLVPGADLAGFGMTAAWLGVHSHRISEVVVVGGQAAVGDAVVGAIQAALEGPAVTLPAAAPTPPGDLAAQFGALATEIDLAEDATPQLMTALGLAGFTVLDSHGEVVVAPDPATDLALAFEAWEVAAIGAMPLTQQDGTLADLGAELAGLLPETSGLPFGELILDGIRTAAADATDPHYAWAQLLVALGANRHEDAHDLLSATPEQIVLTMPQTQLLLRHLVGDLAGYAAQQDPGAARASFAQQAAGGRPCTLSEDEQAILDINAHVTTNASGQLLAALENASVTGAEGANKVLGVLGMILSFGQLLTAYAAMEVDHRLEPLVSGDAGPLDRTITTAAGEQRTLLTTVRNAIGDLQLLNCIRPVLNLAGLDFAVGQDGPLAGVLVDTLVNGTAVSAYVQAQNVNPAETFRDKTTDSRGQVRTYVEGRPQAADYEPEQVEPVPRDVPTKIQVVLKPADILKDFTDATSGAIATASGPPAYIVSVAVELLYRTRWLGINWKTWPLIDYIPICRGAEGAAWAQPTCGAAVTGTIELTRNIFEEPNDEGYLAEDVTRASVTVSLQRDAARPDDFVDAGSTYTATRDIRYTHGCGDDTFDLEGSGGFANDPYTTQIAATEDEDGLWLLVLIEVSGTRTDESCGGGTFTEDYGPEQLRLTCDLELLGIFVAQNPDGSRVADFTCDSEYTDSEGLTTTDSVRGALTVR